MALRLRIPAWAGPGTRIAVNGRAVVNASAGSFATIRREWQDGDRVGLAIDMPLRAEAVDAQHPERISMVQGPLALFATGERFMPYRREQLQSIRQVSPGDPRWLLAAGNESEIFSPWFALEGGPTRLYQFSA
jgi:hypothetical protein